MSLLILCFLTQSTTSRVTNYLIYSCDAKTKKVKAVMTPKHRHQILASAHNNTFKMNLSSSNCTDQSGTTVITVKLNVSAWLLLVVVPSGKQKHTDSRPDFYLVLIRGFYVFAQLLCGTQVSQIESRFDPQHLCCETRLPQRRRRAGNFPQCDSPLHFRNGACATESGEQDRKKGRTKQRGGMG